MKESVEEVGKRGGDKWLSLLRQQSYEEAWLQLQQLVGVGAKVSEFCCMSNELCVCVCRLRTVCV